MFGQSLKKMFLIGVLKSKKICIFTAVQQILLNALKSMFVKSAFSAEKYPFLNFILFLKTFHIIKDLRYLDHLKMKRIKFQFRSC